MAAFATATGSGRPLETVLQRYIDEGLVGGEGFAVDARRFNAAASVSSYPRDAPGIHQGTRQRTPVYNPKTEAWTKRDAGTRRLMQGKEDGAPFKGVAYFAGPAGSSEPNWMAACLPQLS